MKKCIRTTTIILLSTVILSCKKNKDEAPKPQNQNEQEVITTVNLIIKDNGVLVDTFSFNDPDGVGGLAPTIESILLSKSKTYTCTLLILDKTKTPADTTSVEIEKEKGVHQFFFHPSAGTSMTFAYVDYDDNGVPLGLQSLITTGAASTGKLTIILKHQPGVKPSSGNGNEALGETDLEVSFDATIQ